MSDTFSHIDEHSLTRAMEKEFETDPATRPAKEDWGRILEMARDDAARSYREAAFVMHDYYVTERPFVLFLRSFEMEAYDYLTPAGAAGERKVITTINNPSRVEEKLGAALAGRLKALSVANPSQLVTARYVFPRLQLQNEGWQATVRNLMEHAHFIVMDCESLAPGVLWELETIRTANRQNATIIVLPSPGDPDPGKGTLAGAAEIFGATVVKRERPLKDSPELSGFGRVGAEDEIPFDNLDACPLFADLLASAAEKAANAPPFDAAARANELNSAGVSLFNEKRYSEALDLYQQALLLRRQINASSGILVSLINIGILYTEISKPEESRTAFMEALQYARELKRAEDEGLLDSYIGITFKQSGNVEQAKSWLAQAYVIQSEHGKPADVENTLNTLAEVFQSAGDGDQMVETYKILRAYHRQRGDQAGELRDTLQLGATYYSAGLSDAASTLFKEGVRLSRLVGDTEREALCSKMLERIAADIRSNR
jgi:tetratricopeptide (TPR) repeat protein